MKLTRQKAIHYSQRLMSYPTRNQAMHQVNANIKDSWLRNKIWDAIWDQISPLRIRTLTEVEVYFNGD